MKAKDPSGLTKIEAAKKPLTGLLAPYLIPPRSACGFTAAVAGKSNPTPAACADTQLIRPVAALDNAKDAASLTSSLS